MPFKIILHIQNQDAVLGEVDELPTQTDTLLIVHNPRRVDGKDLPNISENVITVMWPIDRLNFIEVLGGEEEDQIIGFVRE
jgi:hypothetical protein